MFHFRYFLGFMVIGVTLGFPSAAQQKNDLVYQKDGEIIQGTILYDNPGSSLKIRVDNNSVWTLYYSNIIKIKRAEAISQPRSDSLKQNPFASVVTRPAHSKLSVQAGVILGYGMYGESSGSPDIYQGALLTRSSIDGGLIGGMLDMVFNKYLSIRGAVEFSNRNWNYSAEGTDIYYFNYSYPISGNFNYNYMTLLLDLKITYPVTSFLTAYVLGGPNEDHMQSAVETNNSDGSTSKTDLLYNAYIYPLTFLLGYNLGAGIDYNPGRVIPFVEWDYSYKKYGVVILPGAVPSSGYYAFEIKAGVKIKI